MRREVRRLALPIVLATIGVVVALGLHPVASATILAAYVLTLGAIGVVLATRVLASRSATDAQSAFDAALRRPRQERPRPAELVRMERELTLGLTNAGYLHVRLLPLLREIATGRLGLDLHRSQDRARLLLGDEVWHLLRPDRPAPVDRNARGASRREIERCVDVLERA
jgi:hypothetical protein